MVCVQTFPAVGVNEGFDLYIIFSDKVTRTTLPVIEGKYNPKISGELVRRSNTQS